MVRAPLLTRGGLWKAAALPRALVVFVGLCLASAAEPRAIRAQESAANEPGAQAELSDAERAELLAKIRRSEQEANALNNQGKLREAIDAAQRMLAAWIKVDSRPDEVFANWLAWIAERQALLADFPAAIDTGLEVVRIRGQLFGDKDWRVTDARLALHHTRLLSGLTPEQRAELQRADHLNGTLAERYRRGAYAEALQTAQEVLEVRRGLLGAEHYYCAISLNNLALLYAALGDTARAEPLQRRALEIRKQVLGEQHPEYADSLNNLASLYNSMGKLAEAEPLYLQALEIRKQVLGEQHTGYAQSLNNVGLFYTSMAMYAEAEPLFQQALQIFRDVLGEQHPQYATCLNNLAFLYKQMADFARAEPLYLRVMEIDKKVLGEQHADYAADLDNLAALYQDMADYSQAEPLHRQALEIRKQVLGEQHPDYALSLYNLASLCEVIGDVSQAQSLYQQALEIRKQVLGAEHPDYAQSLNKLALLHASTGDYGKAESLHRRTLEITKQALGERHPEYARSLNNLGVLYYSLGEYDRAEPLLKQALEIRKQVLGAEHPDYAFSLHSLAMLYSARREFTRGETLYREALEIQAKVFGNQHVRYAESLANLGVLYWLMGDYEQAEPLFREAHQIRETLLGEEHPFCAASLSNLAALSMSRGDYAQAETLYRRALETKARVPGGAELPEYAMNLVDLALICQSTDRPAEGLARVRQGLQIQQAHLEKVLHGTAESAMRDYLQTNLGSLEALLSIAASPAATDEAMDAAFTWMLRRKAMLLDVLCRLREVQTLMGQDPLVRDQVARLRGLRQRLSNAALNPPRGLNADQLRTHVAELNEQVDQLEAELHQRLSADLDRVLASEVSLDQVRGRLPEECALVEFVRRPIFDFHAPEKKPRVKPARYFAFILAAASDVPPKMIDLGEAETVDQAIQDWRAGVASNSELIDGSVLRELLWDPLKEHLGDAQTILISPDGELNRLPFEALTDEDDNYLIERFQFAYLSSGRDLLRTYGEPGHGAVVLADPDYDLGAQARHETAEALLARLGETEVAQRSGLSAEVRGMSWARLPGFASEAQAIGQSLEGTRYAPVKQFSGADALEEVFKSLPAPRILHLITHGFFVPDQPLELDNLPGFGEGRASFGAAQGLARLRGTENRLLRSGIVLAGANALGDETATDVEGDDGWVTAEEISQMDLRGTELVVLSACETGLGDVRTGEGVYGLRRAFFHAGAKTLITSLFKVPDEATSLLMRRFYRNLCAKDMTPLASLREAQLFVLNGGEDPSVDEVPADAERRPPRDWAAFVLSGDWR